MSARPAAVFLDRDGTINVKAPEGDYITRPERLHLLPGAAGAVARLNDAHVPVALVTNQRGIARGLMSERDLDSVHHRLAELLADDGAHLDALVHCPHDTGVCGCRKPEPGMLLEAAAQLGVDDLRATVMIGDSETDIAAGAAVGARTILIAEGQCPRTAADACVEDLDAAVTCMLGS